MKKLHPVQKTALILFGLCIALVFLEAGLRIGGFLFTSLQEYKNIIAVKNKGAYRIMCLGESTTALGGKDSYPSQLKKTLNRRAPAIKFSVINKGRPGSNSTVILQELGADIERYDPDMVITMMGINDEYGDIVPYADTGASKIELFLKDFRLYKLLKLLSASIRSKIKGLTIFDAEAEAQEVTGAADKVGNKDALFYLDSGRHCREQGKYNKAKAAYDKALELDPLNRDIYLELVWLYDLEELEAIYEKAVALDAKNYTIYIDLGRWYRDEGKHDKARKIFEKVLKIDTETRWAYWAYFELGGCYKHLGDYRASKEMYKKAVGLLPDNHWVYGGLAACYKEEGKKGLSDKYFAKATELRMKGYNPILRDNYRKLKEVLAQKGIKLVCAQYPIRSIEPLKKMLGADEGIVFVDNEKVFKDAVEKESYEEYFSDSFGGDFGHCTQKGNRLLAENIADVILKECFGGSF